MLKDLAEKDNYDHTYEFVRHVQYLNRDLQALKIESNVITWLIKSVFDRLITAQSKVYKKDKW